MIIQNFAKLCVALCFSVLVDATLFAQASTHAVTYDSLVKEMQDRDALARLPLIPYRSLQATSYNRESTSRSKPGWFADSDGTGFIRTEQINGKTEWVVMENDGPGCITKMWTPYFYYDLNDHVGPNIRVYLDGSSEPVIDSGLIKFTREGWEVGGNWFAPTARAGDSYMPIPFRKSCIVTTTKKPFYFSINYRSYPKGTDVETFTPRPVDPLKVGTSPNPNVLMKIGGSSKEFFRTPVGKSKTVSSAVEPNKALQITLPEKRKAVKDVTIHIPVALKDPSVLRSLVFEATFDGEQTVWCPVGDFFCCADSIHPYNTYRRLVSASGTFQVRWPMPYQKSGSIRILNLGKAPVSVGVSVTTRAWSWDDRSMHFHANWRPDDVVPGTPFQDWNYIDIKGKGLYVGDAWTVLNIQEDTWWGEGDEKIYVDDAWDKGFPTHFGTGTEDYYGWAGGVLPTRDDEFSNAFLANVRVGGLDGHTQGYNILTRERGLDAIPFDKRLRFDMESSFGTDIRNPWNLLGYSAVTFWYGRPGATCNRPPIPDAVKRPIMSRDDLQKRSNEIKAKH